MFKTSPPDPTPAVIREYSPYGTSPSFPAFPRFSCSSFLVGGNHPQGGKTDLASHLPALWLGLTSSLALPQASWFLAPDCHPF